MSAAESVYIIRRSAPVLYMKPPRGRDWEHQLPAADQAGFHENCAGWFVFLPPRTEAEFSQARSVPILPTPRSERGGFGLCVRVSFYPEFIAPWTFFPRKSAQTDERGDVFCRIRAKLAQNNEIELENTGCLWKPHQHTRGQDGFDSYKTSFSFLISWSSWRTNTDRPPSPRDVSPIIYC